MLGPPQMRNAATVAMASFLRLSLGPEAGAVPPGAGSSDEIVRQAVHLLSAATVGLHRLAEGEPGTPQQAPSSAPLEGAAPQPLSPPSTPAAPPPGDSQMADAEQQLPAAEAAASADRPPPSDTQEDVAMECDIPEAGAPAAEARAAKSEESAGAAPSAAPPSPPAEPAAVAELGSGAEADAAAAPDATAAAAEADDAAAGGGGGAHPGGGAQFEVLEEVPAGHHFAAAAPAAENPRWATTTAPRGWSCFADPSWRHQSPRRHSKRCENSRPLSCQVVSIRKLDITPVRQSVLPRGLLSSHIDAVVEPV